LKEGGILKKRLKEKGRDVQTFKEKAMNFLSCPMGERKSLALGRGFEVGWGTRTFENRFQGKASDLDAKTSYFEQQKKGGTGTDACGGKREREQKGEKEEKKNRERGKFQRGRGLDDATRTLSANANRSFTVLTKKSRGPANTKEEKEKKGTKSYGETGLRKKASSTGWGKMGQSFIHSKKKEVNSGRRPRKKQKDGSKGKRQCNA